MSRSRRFGWGERWRGSEEVGLAHPAGRGLVRGLK